MGLTLNATMSLSAPLTDILPSLAILSGIALSKKGVQAHLMSRVEWDAENETYAEFKKRRSASFNISGMGQKKREGTGKKKIFQSYGRKL